MEVLQPNHLEKGVSKKLQDYLGICSQMVNYLGKISNNPVILVSPIKLNRTIGMLMRNMMNMETSPLAMTSSSLQSIVRTFTILSKTSSTFFSMVQMTDIAMK